MGGGLDSVASPPECRNRKARQIDTAEGIAWRIKRVTGNTQPRTSLEARVKLVRAKVQLAETQAQLVTGAALPFDDVNSVVSEMAAIVLRERQNLPGRRANLCAHQEAGVIHQRAEVETRSITRLMADKLDERYREYTSSRDRVRGLGATPCPKKTR